MFNFLSSLPYVILTNASPSPSPTGSPVPGANAPDLTGVTQPVIDLMGTILNAAIPLVGAIGAIYCIFLGIKFAKAEEQQDREKAKSSLKNAIIGFILIFVLIVVLRLALPIMGNWAGLQI